jgi:hypothetical protein
MALTYVRSFLRVTRQFFGVVVDQQRTSIMNPPGGRK